MALSAGATSDMPSSQDTILCASARSDPPENRDAPPSIFAEGRTHTWALSETKYDTNDI